MNSDHPLDKQEADPKTAEQLRREAVEIVQRRKRGLPGNKDDDAPPPAPSAGGKAEEALERGRQLLEEGRVAEALLRAEAAVGFARYGSDTMADSLALAGVVRLCQNNPQAARTVFNKALEINPAHIPARLGLARAYRFLHQPKRAVPLYVETIPLVPEPDRRSQLRVDLADAYREAGQAEAARRVLRAERGVHGLSLSGQFRAAVNLLIPGDMLGRLLLVLVVLITAGASSLSTTVTVPLAVLALSLLLYLLLQWWRTPDHSGKA